MWTHFLVALTVYRLLCAVCVSAILSRVGSAHQPPWIQTHTHTFTHMLSIPVWRAEKIRIGIRTWNCKEENHKMKIPDILCVCYTYALYEGRWYQRGERRKTLRRERRMFELRTLAVVVLMVCSQRAAANNCTQIYVYICIVLDNKSFTSSHCIALQERDAILRECAWWIQLNHTHSNIAWHTHPDTDIGCLRRTETAHVNFCCIL